MAYDLVMLLIVVFTTWRGAVKGVAWQLAAIGAMVLCFLFATPVSLAIAPLISVEPPLNRWIAMLATYLIFSFACFAGARTVRGWLEAARFEEFDKHLGAAFGLLKGVTICFTITFFAACLSDRAAETVLPTYSGKASRVIMHNLALVLPPDVERVLAPYSERLGPVEIANAKPRPNDRAGYYAQPAENPRSVSGANPPATDPAGSPLKDLLQKLPSQFSETIRDALSSATKTPPDDPAPSDPDSVSGLEPEFEPEPNPRTEARNSAPSTTAELLREVAGLLAADADEFEAALYNLRAELDGIPPDAALAALDDFHADLLGAADPDPQTDVVTPLADRVVRQLRRFRIRLSDLPAEIQSRLGLR